MKRTGLIILIIICLIIFIASLTGGILLTIRSIGWQTLLDQTHLQDHMQRVMQRVTILPWVPAGRHPFSTDESKALDLAGIRNIEIMTVSESITIHSTSSAGQARLSGAYTAAAPLHFIVAVEGDILKIRIDYPRFGVIFNQLKLVVDVPDSYDGALTVRSVSGAVLLPDTQPTDWQRLEIGTVSGRILVEQADFNDIKVGSVSGEIVLRQITGNVVCKSTSGAVRLVYDTFHSSEVRTVSGSVDIALPLPTDMTVSFATVSGGFSNQGLPLTVDNQTSRKLSGSMGDGSQQLDVSTTSGALRLKQR